MLEGVAGIDPVISVDPADIDGLALPDGGVDLIVFGMPADLELGWHLLSKVPASFVMISIGAAVAGSAARNREAVRAIRLPSLRWTSCSTAGGKPI
jgi:hypothetical protein